jgi:hypothetical protein
MADIRITPGSSIIAFTSSLNYKETLTQDASGSLTVYGSGSTNRTEIFNVDGNNGRLFSVSDDLSDSLFSVNTVAGFPVIEAFADNTVKLGKYGAESIVISGSSGGAIQLSGSIKALNLASTSDTTVVTFNTTTKTLGYNTVAGPQGAQGAAGSNGSNGAQGAAGSNGAQGAAGSNGAQGAAGSNGSNGAQGAAGSNGAQGAAGSNGSNGAQGAAGSNGAQGAAGSTGAQGSAGSNGAQGAQGASGGGGSTSGQYYVLTSDGSGGITSNNQVVVDPSGGNQELIQGYGVFVTDVDPAWSSTSYLHPTAPDYGNGKQWHGESVRSRFLDTGTSDFGELLYFRAGTNGWYRANATFANLLSISLLGICLKSGASSGDTIAVLLHGFYGTYNGDYTTLNNQGEPLYISEVTSGEVTNVAPSTTGNVVRIIGHTYNPSDPWVVRFNPDNFWVEL